MAFSEALGKQASTAASPCSAFGDASKPMADQYDLTSEWRPAVRGPYQASTAACPSRP